MKNLRKQKRTPFLFDNRPREKNGFGLAEFLISTVVVMAISAGVFQMLSYVQSTSGYQTEVLGVTENTRVAMSTLGRYILQSGNNPLSAAFNPVTITGTTQVQLCSDLTGSAGGNQGDPDGDILDAEEDVTVRYNQNDGSIELVASDGTVQTLARYISGFNLQYFDSNGNTTGVAADVRLIRVTISGSSNVADPRTGKRFGLTLTSDFTLPNRA